MSRSSIPLSLYRGIDNNLTHVKFYRVNEVIIYIAYSYLPTKLWMEPESEWMAFILSNTTDYMFTFSDFVYYIGVYFINSSKMIGNFPAVLLSFDRLFLKLYWFICNQLPVLPDHRS